jgi:hypothetical protein
VVHYTKKISTDKMNYAIIFVYKSLKTSSEDILDVAARIFGVI